MPTPASAPQQEDDSRAIRRVEDIPSLLSVAGQEIEWLIPDILAAGTVTMISGESGSGKSTLTLGLGAAIAYGTPFLGRETIRRPVVVLDRENPLHVIRERFDRFGMRDGDGFRYWGGWLKEEAPDPGGAIIAEYLARTEPKPVVIVDSLVAFLDGDENDSTQVREYMHKLRRLADLGAAVVVIHHTGKADTSKDYRGSSDLKAAIDVGYTVSNLSADTAHLDKMSVRAFKARFPVESSLLIRFNGEEFEGVGEPQAKPTNRDLLVSLLRSNPNVSSREFEDLGFNSGVTRSRVRDFLRDGARSGLVTFNMGDKGRKFYHLAGEEDSLE